MCVLTGCGKNNNVQENSSLSTNETETLSVAINATDVASTARREAMYVWEMDEKIVLDVINEESAEVPNNLIENDSSELRTYMADVTGDGSKELICIYKVDNKSKIKVYDYDKVSEIKVFNDKGTFTYNQKGKLDKVFDEWFEKDFTKEVRPLYTRDGFNNIVDTGVEYEVISYDGEIMIKMTCLTEEMAKYMVKEYFLGEDKLDIYMKYSDGEFTVNSAFMNYKNRYVKNFK